MSHIKKVSKNNNTEIHAKRFYKAKKNVMETQGNHSYPDDVICNDLLANVHDNPETKTSFETCQGVSCTVTLKEDTFRPHFEKYVEFIACKNIGDSGMYLKHIQKEKKNNNASAAAQIDAINYFECLANTLLSFEQKFEMMANHRIMSMISHLRQTSTPPVKLQNYWNVCSLTAMPSNELIEISTNFKIDARFGSLVMALWLCIHLENIEQTRVENFTADFTKQAFISEMITVYLKSDTAMSMCDVYRWAYQKIFNTFDKTLQTLPAVIERAKNIPMID